MYTIEISEEVQKYLRDKLALTGDIPAGVPFSFSNLQDPLVDGIRISPKGLRVLKHTLVITAFHLKSEFEYRPPGYPPTQKQEGVIQITTAQILNPDGTPTNLSTFALGWTDGPITQNSPLID